VLPSGGVSSVVQQAGDQYCTKTGPVRNWLLVFLHFQLCCIRHVNKSKIFFDKILFRSNAVTVSFHLLKSFYSLA